MVKTQLLPFASLLWLSPNSIVAVGHDCQPVLFSKNAAGSWSLQEKLDQGGATKKAATATGGATGAAFSKFRQMDSRAQIVDTSASSSSLALNGSMSTLASGAVELATVHQNTITEVRAYAGSRERVTAFSTSGVDGKLTVWGVQAIEASIAGLRIA